VGTPSATTPVPSTGRPAAPPTARPAALPPPAEAWPKKHAIAQGDTLSSISDRYYGSSTPERIDFLLKANPQLKNPRAMKIGDQLTIPAWNKPAAAPTAGTSAASPRSGGTAPPSPTAPAPTTPAATVSTRTYEVSDGDSFYSIARSQLGNGARWQELLRLNEDLVNGDPKRLKPGMIIKLP
jgi:nucleoid-associated protein YgaU